MPHRFDDKPIRLRMITTLDAAESVGPIRRSATCDLVSRHQPCCRAEATRVYLCFHTAAQIRDMAKAMLAFADAIERHLRTPAISRWQS
jgi:hypothetical protein